MPLFHIKAIDKNGQIQEYNKEFPDIVTLQNDLRVNGHLLIEFKEKKKKKNLLGQILQQTRKHLHSRTVTDEDIYNLFYELGIILRANVPVIKALRISIEENRKDVLRKFLEDIFFQLKEGGNFSDILEQKTEIYHFTPYIPIIRRGEKTGQLGESFLHIAATIEKRMQIRSEITNTMIYPLILVGTGLVAIYVMLIYVIPRFQEIVKGFKVVLPVHTRVLFALSVFLNQNQDLMVIAFIVLLLALLFALRSSRPRRFLQNMVDGIPLVRKIKFSSDTLQFLSILSNLLSGGVPILGALNLASECFTSKTVREQLKQVVISLRKGDSLANAIKEIDIFPEIIPNMIRVGEESGTMPEVLNELHYFMSQRFIKRTRKYMNLLEPIVIISIALFVGLLIMSILPIILNISDINV